MILIIPDSPTWLAGPVLAPLAGGLLCFLFNRKTFQLALAATLANLVAVFLLLRQFLLIGPMHFQLGGWLPPLGITLRTDGPAILLLLMSAVTGLAITLYAHGYFSYRISDPRQARRHQRQQRYFWPLWLLLLTGLNGLFLSNDVFNLYVTLEIIGIAAAALAALSGKPASQLAAFRYLLVSLVGSLSYLLGVVFLYRSYGVLDLELLQNLRINNGAAIGAALSLMSVGLILKTALVPMHFWLPPAHANALAPASAILSALVVKASFFLLFRLWFEVFVDAVSAGGLHLIGLLGGLAVLWGGVQALRQQRLKLMVAYSTVSQLGYLFIAFPLTATENQATGAWTIVIFMALGHACAKAAMFMAAGAIFLHQNHDRIKDLAGIRAALPVTVFAYGLAAVNLMGLPPSGGFIAKWLLLTSALATGQWWWALVVIGGSLLAMGYLYQVLSRFLVIPANYTVQKASTHSLLLEWPALVLALISAFLGLAASWPLHILAHGSMPLLTLIAGGTP